jgi:hypothetical protein
MPEQNLPLNFLFPPFFKIQTTKPKAHKMQHRILITSPHQTTSALRFAPWRET